MELSYKGYLRNGQEEIHGQDLEESQVQELEKGREVGLKVTTLSSCLLLATSPFPEAI